MQKSSLVKEVGDLIAIIVTFERSTEIQIAAVSILTREFIASPIVVVQSWTRSERASQSSFAVALSDAYPASMRSAPRRSHNVTVRSPTLSVRAGRFL
jgi:hypothetical protein